MTQSKSNKNPAIRYIYLSILASCITIILKSIAAYLTGSVGLFSDAMESFVNLIAGIIALYILVISVIPPDFNHPFGHSKAEYFSSMIEGFLILVAAVSIGYASVVKILNPGQIDELGTGLVISIVASLINLWVGLVLLKAGKNLKSITLIADGKHLLTDVWTTFGVIIGLIIVKYTGFLIIDPILGVLVALNIIYTGFSLIYESVSGLMDTALPVHEQNRITEILKQYCTNEIEFHSFYTRRAAHKSFIYFHLLVPGEWDVTKAHDLTIKIEKHIQSELNHSEIFIHLEPLNVEESYDDYLENRRVK
jgi:cation diffusion facilitator family transporter